MTSNFARSRSWKLRVGATFVAATQLMAPWGAIAQTATASTVIQSRASASYIDFDGVSQVATSNIVQTTVQQVGAFTTTGNNTKNAGPGAPVAVMHTITNTGNGSDNFTITVENPGGAFNRVDVFADVDANGLADSTTSLLSGGALTAAGTGVSNSINVAGGSSFSYVVVYTVPTAAPVGWSTAAQVQVTATNAALYANPADVTRSATDTINRTTQAAFSAALTHSAPQVTSADGNPWGPTPNSGQAGTFTTYTFNYTNNGASPGQIYLRDVLPPALEYIADSAVWSSNPGAALQNTGAFGTGTNANIAYRYDSATRTIEALINNVQPGTSGTVSFKVRVADSASAGQHISQALFSQGSCSVADLASANTPGCADGTTNIQAIFTVLSNYGVQFNLADTTPGTPSGADQFEVTQVVAGGAAQFEIPVLNTGSATDSFKLSLDTATSNFPNGTIFTWYHADKVSPLQNSVGGVGVDTGPIAAGASATIVLQAVVPSSTPVANGVNMTIRATAASSVDSTKYDSVNLIVNNVVAGLVDLTASPNGTALDQGPGQQANVVQSLTVSAGGAGYSSIDLPNVAAGRAVYDLYVRNSHTAALTFNLESSQTPATYPGNLPPGWTVTYHLFNTNIETSVAGGAVSQVTVPSADQVRVIAVVTPAATTSDVTNQDIYFRVKSVSGTVATDYLRNQISVTSATSRGFLFAPAGSSMQIAPGGVVTFAHTLLNNGSLSCGVGSGLSLAASIPAQAFADGWRLTVLEDNGSTPGEIDSGDTTLIDSGTPYQLGALNAGSSRNLLIRVYAPGSAAGGNSVSVTLTATDTDAGVNCGIQSVINTVNVTVGQLVVNKQQLHDATCDTTVAPSSASQISAKPGECIVYRAVVTNNGTAPVSNVALHDVVPAFTTYAATQPAAQCVAVGLDTAVALTAPGADGGMVCGSGATPNSLIPGGTITLQFRVMVNN